MKDKVSISLYSTELLQLTEHGRWYSEQLFTEKQNIRRIQEQFTLAAQTGHREPPEFVILVLLIPNWDKKDNEYTHPEYQLHKAMFLEHVQQEFADLDVVIQDFYEEAGLSTDERKYIHELKARGSCADMMKTRSIINNQDCRHLNIDSNTKIHNYSEFYNQTFGALKTLQADALIACLYSKHYISAQNKVVYTVPGGRIAPSLEQYYMDWCKRHKHDLEDKAPQENSIYSRVFPVALHEIGLTDKIISPNKRHPANPAITDNNEYRITPYVVINIQRSWASISQNEMVMEKMIAPLTALPSVFVEGIECNFQVFEHLVAHKYTALLQDPEVRQSLLNISNVTLDMKIMTAFYNYAVAQADTPEKIAVIGKLSQLFPETGAGNHLTQQLFQCDAATLHQKPLRLAKQVSIQENMQLIKESIVELKSNSNSNHPLRPKC